MAGFAKDISAKKLGGDMRTASSGGCENRDGYTCGFNIILLKKLLNDVSLSFCHYYFVYRFSLLAIIKGLL